MCAVKSALRCGSRNALVYCGAKSVNVSPRSLVARCAVLLLGCVALLQHYRHFVVPAGKIPRRAEIGKRQRAVRAVNNVVGADVAVNYRLRVNRLQRLHYGQHEPEKLVRGKIAVVVNVLQQVFALKIIHDYVGGVVFLKISLYVYNALRARKPRNTARLAQEAFLALFKRFGLGVGCGVNLVCLRVVSVGVAQRIIFLYCHAHL